ncbi:MAG TPA: hypothetical protein VK960_02585 [Acidimicrobiia bacterium]|nr:hypothetical protein [Acidimicrobiia bacterium]
MSSSHDRGSVVVADLTLGAAIVLILASATTAAGVITDAAQSSREAARSAAVEIARGSEPDVAMRRARRLAPDDASLDFRIADRVVRVRVESHVVLPHPVAGARQIDVTADADVPIAPYRSW